MPICETCGEFDLKLSFDPHVCPPEWLYNIESYMDEDWESIRAGDPEAAAVKAGEKYDEGEYGLLNGDEVEVKVKHPDKTDITVWIVTGETLPHYYARPKEEDL